MEIFLACSTTKRNRAFEAGSAPLRAAIMMSLANFPKARPLALAANSLPFAFHCAPMFFPCFLRSPGACQLGD